MGSGQSSTASSAGGVDAHLSLLKHQSVVTSPSAGEGYGPIYRSALSPDKLVETYYDDVRTVYDNFQRGLRISRPNQFLGSRAVLPDGSRGDYQWMTYGQAEEMLLNYSSGLAQLGLQERAPLGVYSINTPEWILSQLASYYRNACVVALYDTLGVTAVTYILNHAEIEIVVCSRDKVQKLLELEEGTRVKHIVVMEDAPHEAAWTEVAERRGVTLHTIASVCAAGARARLDPVPPKASDLATIMYTSGTTGLPKGAMLTHRNIIGFLAGGVTSGLFFKPTDVHISYLPLAHIFEQVVQGIIIQEGGSVGFWQGQVPKLFEDIACLRPTIFPSVPRLFNRLYDKVINAVTEAGGTKKYLFDWGFNSKRYYVDGGGAPTHALWDRIVFHKMQARLGGRVRMIITGSAPISKDVYQFLQICFCCPVVQGYGLTETSAGLTVTWPVDSTSGHVGSPVPSNEVTLMSVPDMNYDATANPPCGEVCVRGVNVMQGYYKDEKQSAEALKDGWFHTGDIGRMNPNGTLSIIDRKKNIFKLSQGEYVAPDYIESVYLKNTYVQQVFVYGDSLQSSLVAVVVPDPETLVPWAEKAGKPTDIAQLCQMAEVKSFLLEQMNRTAKEYSLKGFEQVRAIHVSHEAFSVELDLLTPTFKMKRPQIKQHFAAAIDEMYSSLAGGDK